jgi:hypothetical protein
MYDILNSITFVVAINGNIIIIIIIINNNNIIAIINISSIIIIIIIIIICITSTVILIHISSLISASYGSPCISCRGRPIALKCSSTLSSNGFSNTTFLSKDITIVSINQSINQSTNSSMKISLKN